MYELAQTITADVRGPSRPLRANSVYPRLPKPSSERTCSPRWNGLGYERPWKVTTVAFGTPIARPSVRQSAGERAAHRRGPAPAAV